MSNASVRVSGCVLLALLVSGAITFRLLNAQDQERPQDRPKPNDGLPEEVDADQSYLPVVVPDFDTVFEKESAGKDDVVAQQKKLLEERYDLGDNPSDVWMSAERKQVQRGVRVKLPEGVTWQKLASMSPADVKEQDAWPMGFRPLPHARHKAGGMVFNPKQIEAIKKAEQRDLERFDVAFDLPDHLLPEFPPPIFLTNRPDLGDVSQGQVLSIRNFHELLEGKLTPVQLEGMRLLLTPFPQQQFNATEDRKSKEPSTGVTCLDCHVNGNTNASFHLNPDTRPQALRFRIDTPSLRGMFNQQIHGSKRALRSVEDFTEFEQRTAYFDGDQVTAAKKGINALDRGTEVAPMAQMQIMFDFPPAPKLDEFGRLNAQASELEKRGEELFFGKARCAECHPAPFFLDQLMHNLNVQRFYEAKMVNNHFDHAAGPMKTMTLRGIKDTPPYLHDGRLLTLDDTVEFFNLVLQLKLADEEKAALVAYLLCL
ncbi:MAG: cytochrome B6 [Planctomycetes bacterium]|nr:cytochrome B6 [Planctomycetota bacterium]